MSINITYTDRFPLIPSTAVPIGATVIYPSNLPLPVNLDLNKDHRVHKQVTKYFMYKTLDKWLYGDMKNILAYFKVDNNGPRLIDNLSEYREDGAAKDDEQTIEAKIKYIEKYFLTYDTMYRILKKYIRGTHANWYDLHKQEYFVEEDIKNQLTKILKETIAERSHKTISPKTNQTN